MRTSRNASLRRLFYKTFEAGGGCVLHCALCRKLALKCHLRALGGELDCSEQELGPVDVGLHQWQSFGVEPSYTTGAPGGQTAPGGVTINPTSHIAACVRRSRHFSNHFWFGMNRFFLMSLSGGGLALSVRLDFHRHCKWWLPAGTTRPMLALFNGLRRSL